MGFPGLLTTYCSNYAGDTYRVPLSPPVLSLRREYRVVTGYLRAISLLVCHEDFFISRRDRRFHMEPICQMRNEPSPTECLAMRIHICLVFNFIELLERAIDCEEYSGLQFNPNPTAALCRS